MHSGRKRSAAKIQMSPRHTNAQIVSSPLAEHMKVLPKHACEHPIVEEVDKENVFMGMNCVVKDSQRPDSVHVTKSDDDISVVDQTDSMWTQTRQSFHRSHCTTRLVGRDQEREALIDAIQAGERVYVCGSPGTGKTALVNEVLASIKNISFLTTNCAMTKVNQFMSTLQDQSNEHDPDSCVLVLDEVDHWTGEEVSLLGKYHCIIGIANTLSLCNSLSESLTDGNLRVIRFMPYTVDEISDILKARDKYGLIDGMAIELISRRTASSSGDLRRALDMTIQCIDHHLLSSSTQVTRLTIRDVLSFLNSFLEKEGELISTLSIHHRLIILLCPATSISALYDDYRKRTERLIDALERSDFLDSVRLLASRNLLSLDKGREKRSTTNSAIGGRRYSGGHSMPSPQGKEWSQKISTTGKWTTDMLDKLKRSNAVLSVIFDHTE